jgi:hypothetical protein
MTLKRIFFKELGEFKWKHMITKQMLNHCTVLKDMEEKGDELNILATAPISR